MRWLENNVRKQERAAGIIEAVKRVSTDGPSGPEEGDAKGDDAMDGGDDAAAADVSTADAPATDVPATDTADPMIADAAEADDVDKDGVDKDDADKSRGPAALTRTTSGASERSRPSPRLRTDDGASQQRNRKIFGVLMGTLKRARQESASGSGIVQQQKLQATLQVRVTVPSLAPPYRFHPAY